MAVTEGAATAVWEGEAPVPYAPTATDADADADGVPADTAWSDSDGVADQDGGLELVAVDAAEQRAAQVMQDGAKVRDNVEDLRDLVKKRRFTRLDAYAQRARWIPNERPGVADPEVEGWWLEWRELHGQQQQMVTSPAPQPEASAAAPPEASVP